MYVILIYIGYFLFTNISWVYCEKYGDKFGGT